MQCVRVNILLAFVAHAYDKKLADPVRDVQDSLDALVNKLADKLVDRALKASPFHDFDHIDDVVLRKPSHDERISCPSSCRSEVAKRTMQVCRVCQAYGEDLLSKTFQDAPPRLLSSEPATPEHAVSLIGTEFQKEFGNMLLTMQSNENDVRNAAEKTFARMKAEDSNALVTSLLHTMDPNITPEEDRRFEAAVLLHRVSGEGKALWSKFPKSVLENIRQGMLNLVWNIEPNERVRKFGIVCITNLAQDEPDEMPWSELVPWIFNNAATAQTPTQKETILMILGTLLETRCQKYARLIMAYKAPLGNLISAGLAGDPSLQYYSILLVLNVVCECNSEVIPELQPVLPMMETAMQSLATTTSKEESLESVLQCLVDISGGDHGAEPSAFFNPRLRQWVEMMLAFASAKGKVEDGSRSLAMYWIEKIGKRHKDALLGAVPDFAEKIIPVVFNLLADSDEQEDWPELDDSAEGHDEASKNIQKAAEATLEWMVPTIGYTSLKDILMAHISKFGASALWTEKVAALMAICATIVHQDAVRNIDITTQDTIASLTHQLVQDEHMRVRYNALIAMNHIMYHFPQEFVDRWYSQTLSIYRQAMEDPIDRCARLGVEDLEELMRRLDQDVLAQIAPPLLEAIVAKLITTTNKNIQMSIIESLGTLAEFMDGSSFTDHYDKLMPILLNVEQNVPLTPKLRGSVFDCISRLGFAVGKEKFGPAAAQAMTAILTMKQSSEEPNQKPEDAKDTELALSSKLMSAIERMCSVMKSDFAAFLPALLPRMFAKMRVDTFAESIPESSGNFDEAYRTLELQTKTGLMKVNTGEMYEVLEMAGMLHSFIKNTDLAFLPYVEQTAAHLALILDWDPALSAASMIRDTTFECWAELLAVSLKAVPTQGPEAEALAAGLVKRFMDKVGSEFKTNEKVREITAYVGGLSIVIKKGGKGCLQPDQFTSACDQALAGITKSFEREAESSTSNENLDGEGQSLALEKSQAVEQYEQGVSQVNQLDMEKITSRAVSNELSENEMTMYAAQAMQLENLLSSLTEEERSQIEGLEDEDSFHSMGSMEREMRWKWCVLLGNLIQVNPELYISHAWPQIQPLMQQWLTPPIETAVVSSSDDGTGTAPPINHNMELALSVAGDMCEFMGEAAVPFWPIFMNSCISVCALERRQDRVLGAYAIAYAARIPSFGAQYGAPAYSALVVGLQTFKEKIKAPLILGGQTLHNDPGQRAYDSMVNALAQLLLVHPSLSPDLDACWELVLSELPLKVEKLESKRLNRFLFDETQKPNGGNLMTTARLVRVLGYLVEQYRSGADVEVDLQKDLANFLAQNQETVGPLVAQFSAKQQKQAQKILQEGIKQQQQSGV